MESVTGSPTVALIDTRKRNVNPRSETTHAEHGKAEMMLRLSCHRNANETKDVLE